MFKNDGFKSFLMGFITYAIILDLFGVDNRILRASSVALVILISYFIMQLYSKNRENIENQVDRHID